MIFEQQLTAMIASAMKTCGRCKRAFLRICISCDACATCCPVDADPQRSHYDDMGGIYY